jgi:xanthine dehydrogenase YagS FAD-binding subunit
MHPFEFAPASSEKDAIRSASATSGAMYLAGGTTLVDLMKLDVETPSRLIDINPLPLTKITELHGGVSIGAMVRNSDCAHHDLIVKRNPGSGCPAIAGCNRIHAVLGTSDQCIATHPSDMCVALAALDAVVVTNGPDGARRIPFTGFHLLPGDHPENETVLRPGELITAVEIPAMPFAARSHYLKVRDRASYAFALASAAVALDIHNGVIRQARIALGGVGAKPWRATEAEAGLVGQSPGPAAFQAAAAAALSGAVPQSGNAFKIELAKRTVVRTLTYVSRMV